MYIYIIFYLTSTFFALCYSFSREKYASFCFRILTFLCIFLPLALRYNVGTDYKNYIFLLDLYEKTGRIKDFEKGWQPFVRFIVNNNIDRHLFFVVPAFFSTIILFKYLRKEYFCFSVPIYICFSYIFAFTGVRQAFAAVIFLMAIKNIENDSFLRAIIWGLVSVFFHTSAFILVFLMLFSKLKLKFLNKYFNVIAFSLLIIFIYITNLGRVLFNTVVGYTPYASYLYSKFNSMRTNVSFVGTAIKSFLCCLTLYFADKEKLGKDRYNLTIVFTVCLGLFTLVGMQVQILGRIKFLFDPFYFVMLISIYDSKTKYRKVIVFLFIGITFLLFYRQLKVSMAGTGGFGLWPYHTILSR